MRLQVFLLDGGAEVHHCPNPAHVCMGQGHEIHLFFPSCAPEVLCTPWGLLILIRCFAEGENTGK